MVLSIVKQSPSQSSFRVFALRENKIYCLIILALMILQFIIFKLCYPFPDFFPIATVISWPADTFRRKYWAHGLFQIPVPVSPVHDFWACFDYLPTPCLCCICAIFLPHYHLFPSHWQKYADLPLHLPLFQSLVPLPRQLCH